MKTLSKQSVFTVIACCMLLLSSCNANKATLRPTSNPMTTTSELIEIINRVNDYWQTEHPQQGNSFWNNSAYHIGNMAAYDLTKNPKYKAYSEAWAEHNNWMGAKSTNKAEWKYAPYGEGDDYVLFGDWQVCFQVYCDLYNLDATKDNKKIARAREVMDYQIATPNNDYWWWADGLHMVMPLMTKLYKITGNPLYLDKMHDYFTYACTLMYDKESQLFFRDAKYVYPTHKTKNGLKDFWARGNGWVFAALAKVIQDVPTNHPHRKEYIGIFRQLAETLKESQQPEGYWSRSILDKNQAPGYETSGTAFFTYGLLWGINNNILSEKEYLPVVDNAWRYLSKIALQPNGIVGYVQPIGERADQHQNVGSTTTSDFGVGAYLMATTEMVKYYRTKKQ